MTLDEKIIKKRLEYIKGILDRDEDREREG